MTNEQAQARLKLIEDAGGFLEAWKLYGEELLADTPFDDLGKPMKFVIQNIMDLQAFLKAAAEY
jgi:hypothetical protein